MEIVIDLKSCDTEAEVLLKIGEVLFLGGVNGNSPVQSSSMKGWGLNWDALNDSLSYLDCGGIWGNSPIFEFPLNLVFINYENFHKNEPDQFEILEQILEGKRELYLKDGKVFNCSFEL